MNNFVKRGPGRPPKVRPEAPEAVYTPEPRPNPVVTIPAPRPEVPEITLPPAPLPNPERLVEVEICRKYAPEGQDGLEIKATVPPGTVMSLPVQEAQRALQLGIARATNNTFRI